MYKAGSGTPYWYEWEIGLLECLKMIENTSGYWVCGLYCF